MVFFSHLQHERTKYLASYLFRKNGGSLVNCSNNLEVENGTKCNQIVGRFRSIKTIFLSVVLWKGKLFWSSTLLKRLLKEMTKLTFPLLHINITVLFDILFLCFVHLLFGFFCVLYLMTPFLISCVVESFHSTLVSDSMKIWHDRFFKAFCLDLFVLELLKIFVNLVPGTKSSRQGVIKKYGRSSQLPSRQKFAKNLRICK